MSGQSEPRMLPPDEARDLLKAMAPLPQVFMDLAHTAAVLGEQRDAVLALLPKRPTPIWEGENFVGFECGPEHRTVGLRAWCYTASEWCYPEIPCQLCDPPVGNEEIRRALGVTE